MNDRLVMILDRLTATITNILQENAELKRQLKQQESVIANIRFNTRSRENESQQ